MNKDLLINAITRNAPNKLDGLLTSIWRNQTMKGVPILVVDDSSPESRENHRVVSWHRNLDITHVGSQEWEKYKAMILLSVKSNFIRWLKLWRERWNTPDVRNICQVLAITVLKKAKRILYFDDDIHVDNLHLSTNLLSSGIQGIPIMGCPDLSRFEWIQLYLRFSAEKNNIQYVGESQYADELMLEYGPSIVWELIRRYTDLDLGSVEVYSESDIPEFIPSREEISGGAYVNSRENLGVWTFPTFYNEDWCYAHMIKTHTSVGNIFYPHGVMHNSSIKSVLDSRRLLAEEEWEFFQQYYRGIGSFHYRDVIKWMQLIIVWEIELCQRLLDSAKTYNRNELQTVLEALRKLLEFYNQLETNAGKYFSIYEQHTQENQQWRKIFPLLESLDLSAENFPWEHREKILIVSPHIDDAFLSLGWYIWVSPQKTIEIANVFTISNYTISGIGDTNNVTKQRKQEEVEVCRAYGIMPYFLDYVDAILRVWGDEADYIDANYDPSRDAIYTQLKEELRERFQDKWYTKIYFPLWIWNHVDHELLFRIWIELQKEWIPISFYEEVGYEDALDKEKVKQKALLIPWFHRKILPIRKIANKLKTVWGYASQMSAEVQELVRQSHQVNGGEAVWTIS